MRYILLLSITLSLGGCSTNYGETSKFPIVCDDENMLASTKYEMRSQDISLNIPRNWAALTDSSLKEFDAVFFRDTTEDYYESSFFALMIYEDIKVPLKEYFEFDYNNNLKDPSFTGTMKGQTILNGRECFWQLAHDNSDGHCITLAYYLKDDKTNRVIMIPTSTYLIEDYELELCKLHKLIESIKI